MHGEAAGVATEAARPAAARARRERGRWLTTTIGGALLAALVAWAIATGRRPPDGPVPVAWDRQPCAHCAMLLGDPAFAVQLHAGDGAVLFFDDPGCYFAYVAANAPRVHASWFHDMRADRWLPESAIGFVATDGSPMGWGIGAVDASTAGALTVEQVRTLVLAGRRGDGAPRADRH
jgi:hypothetical protein